MNELRLALRRLRARPAASVASLITLACSIGAAAASWSLLSAVLVHPLPVAAPERLVVVGLRYESRGPRTSTSHTYRKYPAIRDSGVFDGLAAGGSPMGVALVSAGGLVQRRSVFFASHDYFDTLGVRPSLGRAFSLEEDRRGAPLTAILSDRFWRREFDADPRVLGREIAVEGQRAVVVGVAPRGFRGLDLTWAPEMYMPLHTIEQIWPAGNLFDEPSQRGSSTAWVRIVGRIRTDATIAQTQARLSALALPGAQGAGVVLTEVTAASLPEAARNGISQFVSLLGTTVVLLLTIGYLTVGLLLLIRTESRRDEFAMCLALGASRGRLARGVAAEGALLAAAGALLALPISEGLFAGVRAFELPGRVSLDLLELSLDWRVVAAAAVAAAGATIAIAVVAGVFGFSADIADALRSRAGATPRVTRRRTRAALVTAQVAVAFVLVSGAGLFAGSVTRALGLNPGLDVSRLVTGGAYLEAHGYDNARARLFFEELRARLEASPALRSVSFTYSPGAMGGGYQAHIDGEVRTVPSTVEFVGIDEHYFSTVGLPIVRGRGFSRDDRPGSPLVGIVSESLGRFVARGGDPLEHHVEGFSGQPPDMIRIIGVVPDIITRVNALEPLVLYRPISQQPERPRRIFTLRAAGNTDAAIRETISAIRAIDAAVIPFPMTTLDDEMLDQMGPQRLGMLVMGALGLIAVLLTALGTYVLAESMTSMRRKEMGIRAALGASGRQLGGLVLGETVRLVGVGAVVGLGLACVGASTIRAFLFQIQPLDWPTLGLVTVVIMGVAIAVSLQPAFSAARVDLARILREE